MLEARRKAWETRRARYGPRGHDGAYTRPSHPLGLRALKLVLRMHEEGALSEGQCCKALDLDRVEFRALADAARSASPPSSEDRRSREASSLTLPGRKTK